MLKIFCIFFLAISVVSCGGSSTESSKDPTEKQPTDLPKITGVSHVAVILEVPDVVEAQLKSNIDANFTVQSNVEGQFGTFSIQANGVWSYLPNKYNYQSFKKLNADKIEDVFVVSTTQGLQQEIKLTSDIYYQRLISNSRIRLEYDGETGPVDISAMLDYTWVLVQATNSDDYYTYEYKDSNNLTSVTNYTSDYQIASEFENLYHKNSEEKVIGFDRTSKTYSLSTNDYYLRNLHEYSFDWDHENNRERGSSYSAKTFNSMGETISTQILHHRRPVYNNAGQLSEVYESNANNPEYLIAHYTYKDNAIPWQVLGFNGEDSHVRTTNLVFDEHGRTIASIFKNLGQPELNRVTLFIYLNSDTLVTFSISENEFISQKITSSVNAHVLQYKFDQNSICGDIDRATSSTAFNPATTCRMLTTNLPSTTALPSPADLGY
ncbi:VCBS domain-containing protein [Catenovulum sp. SX2]|uniref:VCBS domain-containing protein n=1 Tax=Catenovulum sp. SX2 TaxID=3398614 RepID=UPI003F856E29